MSVVSEEKIVELVDAFYAKVRADVILAPVFDRAITAADWPRHLAKMYDFWSSVMLTTGRYKGNPLAVHARLPDLEEGMFARWLALFGETASEIFPDEAASVFHRKSQMIADSLKLGLFFRPGNGVPLRPSAR
jgi:hemoglobin